MGKGIKKKKKYIQKKSKNDNNNSKNTDKISNKNQYKLKKILYYYLLSKKVSNMKYNEIKLIHLNDLKNKVQTELKLNEEPFYDKKKINKFKHLAIVKKHINFYQNLIDNKKQITYDTTVYKKQKQLCNNNYCCDICLESFQNQIYCEICKKRMCYSNKLYDICLVCLNNNNHSFKIKEIQNNFFYDIIIPICYIKRFKKLNNFISLKNQDLIYQHIYAFDINSLTIVKYKLNDILLNKNIKNKLLINLYEINNNIFKFNYKFNFVYKDLHQNKMIFDYIYTDKLKICFQEILLINIYIYLMLVIIDSKMDFYHSNKSNSYFKLFGEISYYHSGKCTWIEYNKDFEKPYKYLFNKLQKLLNNIVNTQCNIVKQINWNSFQINGYLVTYKHQCITRLKAHQDNWKLLNGTNNNYCMSLNLHNIFAINNEYCIEKYFNIHNKKNNNIIPILQNPFEYILFNREMNSIIHHSASIKHNIKKKNNIVRMLSKRYINDMDKYKKKKNNINIDNNINNNNIKNVNILNVFKTKTMEFIKNDKLLSKHFGKIKSFDHLNQFLCKDFKQYYYTIVLRYFDKSMMNISLKFEDGLYTKEN